MAEPIVINVGWVVKLLEGWTNKLSKYGLIYAGLSDEAFCVSAAKPGVLIDKGRENDVLMWKQVVF